MPVALVTGASRGIGKQSALYLARAGFEVAIGARTVVEGETTDRSGRVLPGSLESTAASIEEAGRAAMVLRMDLLDRSSLSAAASAVEREWGRVDVLVNNAVHTGDGSMELFSDLTVSMIEAKLEANVIAQVILIKELLPGMLRRGGGTIINMTSAVAISDPPAPAGKGGWGMGYAMSKGAFHRVAGILAVELGAQGIRAYNVEPGFVVTETMSMHQAEIGLEGVYRGAPPSVPASVVAWLATSPGAGALNGKTVRAQRFALERRLHPDWR